MSRESEMTPIKFSEEEMTQSVILIKGACTHIDALAGKGTFWDIDKETFLTAANLFLRAKDDESKIPDCVPARPAAGQIQITKNLDGGYSVSGIKALQILACVFQDIDTGGDTALDAVITSVADKFCSFGIDSTAHRPACD